MVQNMSRRNFVKVVGVAAAAAGLSLMSGCSSYPSVEEALSSISVTPTVTSVIEPGRLTVGVNTQNAPYCWPTSSGDGLQGIDVDVAMAIGERMGLKVKFVNVGNTFNGAAGGTCDIVMGVSSETLPGSEVLVGNYAESAPAVFAKNVTSVVSDANLEYATVGVQEDSASSRAAKNIAPNAVLTNFSTLNDAFAALEKDTVQYVACDSFMGGYLASSYTDIQLAGAFSLAQTRGVAVAATNSQMQTAVTGAFDRLATDSELKAIRTRWVGGLPSINTTNQVAITIQAAPAPEPTPEPEPVEEDGVGDEELGYWYEGEWYWY